MTRFPVLTADQIQQIVLLFRKADKPTNNDAGLSADAAPDTSPGTTREGHRDE